MPAEYNDEIREAAKVLHLEGLSSPEIRARLETGKAGLPYAVKPSTRTIDLWRKRWKREGVRPGFAVREGEEETAATAAYRRLIGIHREVLARLDESVQSGKVDLQLSRQAGILQTAVDQARARHKAIRKRETGQKLTGEDGAALGGGANADTDSILESLAAEIRTGDRAGSNGRDQERESPGG